MSKAQLTRLIDLPDDALQQVLDYAATLSPDEAVDHFRNLLGESPAALEFMAAFNAKRAVPAATAAPSATDAVPKSQRRKKKAAAPLHMPAARTVTTLAAPPGATYHKKGREDDYIASRSPAATTPAGGSKAATPVPSKLAVAPTPPPVSPQPHKLPATNGSLIQDALAPKAKNKSKPKAAGGGASTGSVKVSITGGTAMHGASTVLADFDAAIRALEMSTNPTLNESSTGEEAAAALARRRCNCVATRHPLQTAAPSCLRCGKVVCVKEGLGPCTFCGTPLLSGDDVQAMVRALRAARGREKMAADRAAHARLGATAKTPRASMPTKIAGTTRWGGDDGDYMSPAEAAEVAEAEALAKARAHRDRLLAFQAQNAQRTTVRDEAADFDVGDALAAAGNGGGGNMWASPEERAEALRRQQKLLRQMEWEARPAYETRQQVISIDLAGKKVFRKTVKAERPTTPPGSSSDKEAKKAAEVVTEAAAQKEHDNGSRRQRGGPLGENPLLGNLLRPVYVPKSKERGDKNSSALEDTVGDATTDTPLPVRTSQWRRVQDDLDDNEAVILDGGLLGSDAKAGRSGDGPEQR